MIYLNNSPIHGIGVFTSEKIYKDTIITVDVQLIKHDEIKPHLKNYIFPFTNLNGVKYKCIVKHYFNYCNHQDNPNMKIYAIDKINLTKSFKVLKDINPNEEITLKYII